MYNFVLGCIYRIWKCKGTAGCGLDMPTNSLFVALSLILENGYLPYNTNSNCGTLPCHTLGIQKALFYNEPSFPRWLPGLLSSLAAHLKSQIKQEV